MIFKKLLTRPESNYFIVDGIRAIAVLWVIFFHSWVLQIFQYPQILPRFYNSLFLAWVTRGDLGVDLFFVISGFLIGSILLNEIKKTGKVNFKRFYARRALRLMPAYWFTLLLGFCFTTNIGLQMMSWSNLLYINNYVRAPSPIHLWSLSIEEQFYIVVPFLLLFVLPEFRNKAIFFIALTIIQVGLSAYYVFIKYNYTIPFNFTFASANWFDLFWNYYVLTHLRYVGLLAGVAIAYLHTYHSEEIKKAFSRNILLQNGLIILSIIVLLFISFTPLGEVTVLKSSVFYHLPRAAGQWYEVLHRPVFSYLTAFLILACLYADAIVIKPVKWFLSLKLFYPIAQLSYSAYLYHAMNMVWLFPKTAAMLKGIWTDENVFILNIVLSIVNTFVMATLMYYFIEQPFNKIRNKVFRSDPPHKKTL